MKDNEKNLVQSFYESHHMKGQRLNQSFLENTRGRLFAKWIGTNKKVLDLGGRDGTLTKHFIELRAASPEGSAHVLDIAGLKVSSIKFWSLWEYDELFGCGALKFLDDGHGEFKSIRVHDNFRNKGNGIKVINHLINEAKTLKIKRLSIETGAGKFFEPAGSKNFPAPVSILSRFILSVLASLIR